MRKASSCHARSLIRASVLTCCAACCAVPAVQCACRATLCLQVWDLSTGTVRQTLERAHSGSEVPCITDLTVWEGHIVSASLDGLIKIWEPADPSSSLILNPTPIFTFPEQVRYWVRPRRAACVVRGCRSSQAWR